MSTETPITLGGKQAIEAELEHLIRVERENLKRVISDARELGDLRENAEYHTAKEKQSMIEGRILQLQGILASAKVVDISKIASSKIVFGATVTLYDTQKEVHVTYQLVGDEEADSKKGKISYKSPLGRALVGREQGDTVIVKAPKGDIEYDIESLFYK